MGYKEDQEERERERNTAIDNFDFEGLAMLVKEARAAKLVFTREEVAKHNTEDDCWMIIKNNVYDVTPYMAIHPGGVPALMRFAGRDGTENVQFHSKKMMKLLDSFMYIGRLGEPAPTSCIIS